VSTLLPAGLATRTVFPNLIRRSAASVRVPSAGEPDSSLGFSSRVGRTPASEPGSPFNQVREFALGAPKPSEPDSPQANQIRAFRSRRASPVAPDVIRRRPSLRIAGDVQAEPGSRVSNRRSA
jgi:hypothetical protein